MWRDGGWDVQQVVDNFDSILGQHLQHVGMTMPVGYGVRQEVKRA